MKAALLCLALLTIGALVCYQPNWPSDCRGQCQAGYNGCACQCERSRGGDGCYRTCSDTFDACTRTCGGS